MKKIEKIENIGNTQKELDEVLAVEATTPLEKLAKAYGETTIRQVIKLNEMIDALNELREEIENE